MTEKEGRQLDYGGDFIQEPEPSPEVMALRQRMREFVETPYYKDLELLVNECLAAVKVPPPKKQHEEVGYFVYNLTRDAYSQLTWMICSLATAGDLDRQRGAKL